jgi:hypothetical protein
MTHAENKTKSSSYKATRQALLASPPSAWHGKRAIGCAARSMHGSTVGLTSEVGWSRCSGPWFSWYTLLAAFAAMICSGWRAGEVFRARFRLFLVGHPCWSCMQAGCPCRPEAHRPGLLTIARHLTDGAKSLLFLLKDAFLARRDLLNP